MDNAVRDSARTEGAKLVSLRDNLELSVTDTKIAQEKEKLHAVLENQRSTPIFQFASPHLPRTWYVDQSTSLETYTSEPRYRKRVDHVPVDLSANKSDYLAFMRFA